MNVIVSNKYAAMLSNLNIDLIKSINGEFAVEDLIAQFDNFFFNKMVLDITAIKDYRDISNIQKLSVGMDMSKIILLLDDSPEVNAAPYLSQLVSMGIYNFTRNIDAISYLIDKPNSYKDVAQFQILGTPVASPTGEADDKKEKKSSTYINENLPVTGFGTRVIGFKNLTEHGGATTLVYMLKKQMESSYRVLAVEVDKNDFLFFNDPELRSVSSNELASIIKNPNNNYDVILVDINNSNEEKNIVEMLYLIEPTTIKLNKMIRRDRNVLEKIREKKVVLNQSLLDEGDIKDFEEEASCTVFFNVLPLDDKKDKHYELSELLNKLGFDRQRITKDDGRSGKLFNIVKEE